MCTSGAAGGGAGRPPLRARSSLRPAQGRSRERPRRSRRTRQPTASICRASSGRSPGSARASASQDLRLFRAALCERAPRGPQERLGRQWTAPLPRATSRRSGRFPAGSGASEAAPASCHASLSGPIRDRTRSPARPRPPTPVRSRLTASDSSKGKAGRTSCSIRESPTAASRSSGRSSGTCRYAAVAPALSPVSSAARATSLPWCCVQTVFLHRGSERSAPRIPSSPARPPRQSRSRSRRCAPSPPRRRSRPRRSSAPRTRTRVRPTPRPEGGRCRG